MSVLVIGASGFLGAEIARRLELDGREVLSLSRSGRAYAGRGLTGDVRRPLLGLERAQLEELSATVTHVVSCFGSVSWASGPRIVELHALGTRNVLELAAGLERLERLVHVSSVLALGRAAGRVSDELDVGQQFRSWYDYAKFSSERIVRESAEVPYRVLRLGPVLGVGPAGAPSTEAGILAAVPPLLRGYPVPLAERGRFPCYVSDVETAAWVAARALDDPGDATVWTYFDPRRQTLAAVLTGLCSAWGVVPRIVGGRRVRRLGRWVAPALGVPDPLLAYAEPWVELDDAVLRELPAELPEPPQGYVERTGEAVRRRSSELLVG